VRLERAEVHLGLSRAGKLCGEDMGVVLDRSARGHSPVSRPADLRRGRVEGETVADEENVAEGRDRTVDGAASRARGDDERRHDAKRDPFHRTTLLCRLITATYAAMLMARTRQPSTH